MSALSPDETALCKVNPIGRRLDALRDEFLAKYPSNDLDWQKTVRSDGDTVNQLISILLGLPAATRLPSRHSTARKLNLDLATIVFPLVDRGLDVEKTAVLLKRVVKLESDHNIWCAVYDLVASVIPATPAPRDDTSSAVQDTPLVASSGTVHNIGETRGQMDPLIREEMSDKIYFDVPEFFDRIFHSIPGLQSLAEDVFTRYKNRKSFPKPCTENKVIEWFEGELESLVALASNPETAPKDLDTTTLTSRSLVAMPELPLDGATVKRKMDIGFASGTRTRTKADRCDWADVLVAGELKESPAKDGIAKTWYDLGRYVQRIYAKQDTRLYAHGFTVCGDVMTVWMFDRGAIYSAPAFNVGTDGLKFVTVMLGYLLMNESQLGLDPTVVRDGNQQYISIGDKRFCLEEVIHRSDGIICRGTTCWKASLNGEDYVIKDSWQYDGKEDEGKLLEDAQNARVQHIPKCYHYETVQIGDTDDDLLQRVRNGMDIPAVNKYRPRRTSSTSRTTAVFSTSSSLRKRVASASLDDRQPKRSRSNTQTGIQEGGPLENRRHKRIVMGPGKCGKPLNLARTRVGVLLGLRDGISGLQDLYKKAGYIHRDVSKGNILISEDEKEGMIIDLDHAIRIGRAGASGAKGRTGTRVFMSIGALREKRPQSYMDDLESIFWLLFWICIHFSGPEDKNGERTEYEEWNFEPIQKLGDLKFGLVGNQNIFLERVNAEFTDYYQPLAPWINKLRREVFPNNQAWEEEDEGLFDRMKDVLRRAMEDPEVGAAWPAQFKLESPASPATAIPNHRYGTRSKAARLVSYHDHFSDQ